MNEKYRDGLRGSIVFTIEVGRTGNHMKDCAGYVMTFETEEEAGKYILLCGSKQSLSVDEVWF